MVKSFTNIKKPHPDAKKETLHNKYIILPQHKTQYKLLINNNLRKQNHSIVASQVDKLISEDKLSFFFKRCRLTSTEPLEIPRISPISFVL